MKRTMEIHADEAEVGQLIHVPAFASAPERMDPIDEVFVDFEAKRTHFLSAGERWDVPQMEYVKVVPK